MYGETLPFSLSKALCVRSECEEYAVRAGIKNKEKIAYDTHIAGTCFATVEGLSPTLQQDACVRP